MILEPPFVPETPEQRPYVRSYVGDALGDLSSITMELDHRTADTPEWLPKRIEVRDLMTNQRYWAEATDTLTKANPRVVLTLTRLADS